MTVEAIRAAMAADGAEDVRAVEVPKWGKVYVRDISAGESDRWVAKSKDLGDLAGLDPTAFVAAMRLCDETGKRVFDPLNADDLAFLSKRRREDMNLLLNVGESPGN
jgi:hypothetical protein